MFIYLEEGCTNRVCGGRVDHLRTFSLSAVWVLELKAQIIRFNRKHLYQLRHPTRLVTGFYRITITRQRLRHSQSG